MKLPFKIDLNGKSILVTGSPGFIGANLVLRLLKEMNSGTFEILQLRSDSRLHYHRFTGLDLLRKLGLSVDKENYVLRLAYLVHCLFYTLLKVASVLCSGNHARKVKR